MRTGGLLLIAAVALSGAPRYPGDKFVFAQLKYAGAWNTRPTAVRALAIELMNRTSVNAAINPRTVTLSDPDLFYFPFLLMTGSGPFTAFPAPERNRLRSYLEQGGVLLIDNSDGDRGGGFDQSVRRELSAIFPDAPLSALPQDHSLYRSFYLLRQTYFGGRVRSAPFLEGVTLRELTPVIYSINDAAGAWERGDDLGRYLYDVLPGGEPQRALAFKFGVNAVLYALTANYKKDAIHVRTLLNRGRFRAAPMTP